MNTQILTKLASYLDSVGPDSPNYDYVCYIKAKIAEDGVARNTDTKLDDADVTTSNTEGDAHNQNYEGGLMDGVFRDLDVLNAIDKKKKSIDPVGGCTPTKTASLFDALAAKL